MCSTERVQSSGLNLKQFQTAMKSTEITQALNANYQALLATKSTGASVLLIGQSGAKQYAIKQQGEMTAHDLSQLLQKVERQT